MTIDIKFSLNQVGLSIEARQNKGQWETVDLISTPNLPNGQPCHAMEFARNWLKARESYGINQVYFEGL